MTTNISDRKSFVTLLLHHLRPIGFPNRPSPDPATHIMAGQTPTRTDLKSRRNIIATLTLLAVMGCQQSDTVVRTEAPLSAPTQTNAPFSTSSGDEHPDAQRALDELVASQGQLSLLSARTPTVWTAQSLALEVLPGSPLPVRFVAEPVPAPAEPVAATKQSVARPTTAAAPAATAAAAPPPTTAAAPPPTTAAAPPPTTAAAPAPAPVVPAAAVVTAAPAAADIAARTNSVRAGRGVPALGREASLDSAAAGWARELATSGVLRHSGLPQQLLGKPWSTVGENVGFGATSVVIHDALVNSAGHLANIVSPNFTRLGVGAAVDANGRLWVVELFAG